MAGIAVGDEQPQAGSAARGAAEPSGSALQVDGNLEIHGEAGSINAGAIGSLVVNPPAHRPHPVPEFVGDFAVAVRRQWTDEAQVRRVNDGKALPLAWSAAPPELFEESAAAPPPGTTDSAGTGRALAALLDRLPGGRLVVLGGPGAGKTVMLIDLLLALLAGRSQDAPVPVLLSLSSWNPLQRRFRDWLAAQLVRDHPGLGERLRAPGRGTRAELLLDRQLLLPILDGLDEIPAPQRPHALEALNSALQEGGRLVLACRTDDYRAAVQQPPSYVKLSGAIGVELHEPAAEGIARSLRREAGAPSPAADRWTGVLGAGTPVDRALRTPLMMSLANTIYNPRPNEDLAYVPHPAELLDSHLFPTSSDIERHLFGGFVPAAYRAHPNAARRSRWTPEQAQRYLSFLARHLEHGLGGTRDLAWWQLQRALPRRTSLPVLVTCTVLVGVGLSVLVGLRLSWDTVGGAAVVGVVASLVSRGNPPTGRLVWSWRWPTLVGIGVLVCARCVFIGFAHPGRPAGPTLLKLSLGGVLCWLALIATDATPQPAELVRAPGPEAVLARDRRAFLLCGLVCLAVPLAAVAYLDLTADHSGRLPEVALQITLYAVLTMYGRTAWGPYALARTLLALRGDLPWRLNAFLRDAHQCRGVLHRTGSVYQFRHALLQQSLAGRADR